MSPIFIALFIIFNMTVALELFPVLTFLLSNTLSLLLLLVIPGALFLSILRLKSNSFWEKAVLTVGLSTSLIMLFGLGVNILLPVLGVANPLARLPLLNSLSLFILALFVISFYRNKKAFLRRDLLMNIFKQIENRIEHFKKWKKKKNQTSKGCFRINTDNFSYFVCSWSHKS